ncbi:DUF3168 domain-containing protein [Parvularcula sp. IMCC14364]|uniref:DUF3168 domain-containing protein n=1 Tax=Parvularcula sp. IMCC14364 TaxID=3067902 RepID=UPI00274082D6|nr:DUF3168 domain-containing protein [Parvularcula sp. IMCC14364]
MLTKPALALQEALWLALTSDPVLPTLIGSPPRVYDQPPPEVVFPYLTIGETRLRALDGIPGAIEHDLRLHAWSRYEGRAEVKEIMSAVYDILQDAPLNVTGARLVCLRYVFGDIFQKADAETFHAVMRYRAVTEPVHIP